MSDRQRVVRLWSEDRHRDLTSDDSLARPLGGTVAVMTDERVWTAAELEQLTPDERDRIVKEGMATDLSELPSDFLARARAKGRALLEEREVTATDGT